MDQRSARTRSAATSPPTRRAGFTLLEALLVIFLIGVIAAFSWPDFHESTRAARLRESVRRMTHLVAMCRAEAMNQSRVYRISLLPDGTLLTLRQLDAVLAPETYVQFDAPWAQTPILLDEVFVEGVLPLADGPPPLIVEDDTIDFEYENEEDLEPMRIDDLTEPLNVDFQPDGTSGSARWVLRDGRGTGVQMTLDGRIGRLEVVELASIDPDQVQPPTVEPIDRTQIPYERDFDLREDNQR